MKKKPLRWKKSSFSRLSTRQGPCGPAGSVCYPVAANVLGIPRSTMESNARWHLFDTRFGSAAILFSLNPFRLHRICLPQPGLESILACRGCKVDHGAAGSSLVSEAAAFVAGYFDGQKIDPPWHLMDMQRFTDKQERVYRQVAGIAYGKVATYGDVARAAGLPGAARFVGNCMAQNPYPVFVPCHRVVLGSGKPGCFGAGRDLKRRMLELEDVLPAGGRSDVINLAIKRAP